MSTAIVLCVFLVYGALSRDVAVPPGVLVMLFAILNSVLMNSMLEL